MNYRLILKSSKTQPTSGSYSEWKEQIAEECFYQCVYCSIHENHWGGIDHFHIDHFRPKSFPEFKHLVNDICNLFYSCPICNRFKKDDFPANPDLRVPSYPDPSVTDYSTIFNQNDSTFEIVGNNPAACYIIHRLYLNRPQLIYERRESILKEKETHLTQEIAHLASVTNDKVLMSKALNLVSRVRTHLAKRERIRPYKLVEIRRP